LSRHCIHTPRAPARKFDSHRLGGLRAALIFQNQRILATELSTFNSIPLNVAAERPSGMYRPRIVNKFNAVLDCILHDNNVSNI
jgi:hypothetical protein